MTQQYFSETFPFCFPTRDLYFFLRKHFLDSETVQLHNKNGYVNNKVDWSNDHGYSRALLSKNTFLGQRPHLFIFLVPYAVSFYLTNNTATNRIRY